MWEMVQSLINNKIKSTFYTFILDILSVPGKHMNDVYIFCVKPVNES